MGTPKHEPNIDWQSTATLGAMIEHGEIVLVNCDKCGRHRYLKTPDLIALAEKVGLDFSLKNRRTPCRFAKRCQGWNSFHYLRGVYRPFRDYRTAERWIRTVPSKPHLL